MQLQTINIKTVDKLTNAKLVLKREELQSIIKEAQDILDSVNEELLSRVKEQGIDGKLAVNDRSISLVHRPIFKDVTLETAARYNALKTVLDSSKLIPLWKSGRKIKGLTVSEYITVR